MDLCNSQQQSLFSIKGQFSGFFTKANGELKYLLIAVENQQFKIKLSKEWRLSYSQYLLPGDWIQVWVEQKHKPHTNEVKLKAYRVNKLSQNSPEVPSSPAAKPISETKAKILVCQKSGCLKRGGKNICQKLETELCAHGLQNQVKIERTGCQKRCSKGPKVVMAGKNSSQRFPGKEVLEKLIKRLVFS